MECFIKVRVLRWQDWSQFFDDECLPLLKDLGTVQDVVCYEDVEDPSVFAYRLSYRNEMQLSHFLNSSTFTDVFGSYGTVWEVLNLTAVPSALKEAS